MKLALCSLDLYWKKEACRALNVVIIRTFKYASKKNGTNTVMMLRK